MPQPPSHPLKFTRRRFATALPVAFHVRCQQVCLIFLFRFWPNQRAACVPSSSSRRCRTVGIIIIAITTDCRLHGGRSDTRPAPGLLRLPLLLTTTTTTPSLPSLSNRTEAAVTMGVRRRTIASTTSHALLAAVVFCLVSWTPPSSHAARE